MPIILQYVECNVFRYNVERSNVREVRTNDFICLKEKVMRITGVNNSRGIGATTVLAFAIEAVLSELAMMLTCQFIKVYVGHTLWFLTLLIN